MYPALFAESSSVEPISSNKPKPVSNYLVYLLKKKNIITTQQQQPDLSHFIFFSIFELFEGRYVQI